MSYWMRISRVSILVAAAKATGPYRHTKRSGPDGFLAVGVGRFWMASLS
jgi:hypothetical protein